ncbi:MAG: acyl-CoA thioesterase [Pseudomonadales bacterium]
MFKKSQKNDWDYPEPFVLSVVAKPEDVDAYGHVNNVVYIKWLEACAWAHSAAVGLSESRCVEMARGMAVRAIHVEYLAAAYDGDEILVGNWIAANDGRLRVTRRYQLLNQHTGITVMRGDVDFVCLNLSSGRPARQPPEFVNGYSVALT